MRAGPHSDKMVAMSDQSVPPSDPQPDPQPVPPPPGGPAMPPPPPGVPAYGAPAVSVGAPPSNGLGTAALIMGILQFFCLGTIGSILAVVFGKIGMNKAARGEATNGGVAKAGFWLGIVGLILSVLGIILAIVLVVFGVAAVNDSIDESVNTRTGLSDGTYVMDVRNSIRINDRCSFSGDTVRSDDGSGVGDVHVAGMGTAQCGSGDTPDAVQFTVTNGVAMIVAVAVQ